MANRRTKKSEGINLRPMGDYVAIEPLEEDDTTPGGIIMPDKAKKVPTRGIVRAVGPGRLTETGVLVPLECKVGDEVYYSKYTHNKVKVDGKEYKIMCEDDVFAVIEK